MDVITQAKRLTSDQADPEIAHAAQRLVAEGEAFWDYDPATAGVVSLVLNDRPDEPLLTAHLDTNRLRIDETMRECV